VKQIRYYSNYIMAAIYISLGLLFLFTDIATDAFPAYRKILGCVLIGYGSLRTYLNIKKIRQEEDERN
jgi:hypothetical protein